MRDDSQNPVDSPSKKVEGAPEFLEIDTARKTRWIGLAAYLLLFLAIAAAIVLVFIRFSGSVGMAVLLVGFMVGYMVIMGHLAGRNSDDRNF